MLIENGCGTTLAGAFAGTFSGPLNTVVGVALPITALGS